MCTSGGMWTPVCTAGGDVYSKCAEQEGGVEHQWAFSAHIAPSCTYLQAMTPKAMQGLRCCPKEETAVSPRRSGRWRGPWGRNQPASFVVRRVTEKEEEVAGDPRMAGKEGWCSIETLAPWSSWEAPGLCTVEWRGQAHATMATVGRGQGTPRPLSQTSTW